MDTSLPASIGVRNIQGWGPHDEELDLERAKGRRPVRPRHDDRRNQERRALMDSRAAQPNARPLWRCSTGPSTRRVMQRCSLKIQMSTYVFLWTQNNPSSYTVRGSGSGISSLIPFAATGPSYSRLLWEVSWKARTKRMSRRIPNTSERVKRSFVPIASHSFGAGGMVPRAKAAR